MRGTRPTEERDANAGVEGREIDAPYDPPARRVSLVVIVVACSVVVVLAVGGFFLRSGRPRVDANGGLREGKGNLDRASDCKTSLAMTTRCVGEDSSFQECHYHLRAEGVPDPRVCAAFLSGPDAAAPATADEGPCPETRPAGWRPVDCNDFHVHADMLCFRCTDQSHTETDRELLQAFDRSCDMALVLKSCNEPLAGGGGP
jgi:hypothetical protein